MINLLVETYKALVDNRLTENDVDFVGSKYTEHQCSWEDFKKLADQEYNNGFGVQVVATDLVVVFKDGSWLERDEYAGSECWTFKKVAIKATAALPIHTLFSSEDGWGGTVGDLNAAVN